MKITAHREFLEELFATWGADKPGQMAAALAYYGTFSIAPMLFVAVTVAGVFINESAITDRLMAQLSSNLGPETAQLVEDIVVDASQSTSGDSLLISLIGLGALLYASTGLFAQLQFALNTIWEVPPSSYSGTVALIKNRLLAFGMVLGLAVLLVLITFTNFVISTFGQWLDLAGYVTIATHIAAVVLLGVSFALIYKTLPQTTIAWRDVWLGAMITALAFDIGRWLVGLFLTNSNTTSAFQAAGSLAVLLLSIYYLAQIFLFGVVFTKVYASHFGSRRGAG
jgi:membrane protein